MADTKKKPIIDAKYAGVILSGLGGVQSAIGNFFQAKSAQNNLRFQSKIADMNARTIREQGNQRIAQMTERAGRIKSAQRANQGARGIAISEGSAAEELASTDLAKEQDKWTIDYNTQMAVINERLKGDIARANADSISPLSALSTSLLSSASAVAPSWYNLFKKEDVLGGTA